MAENFISQVALARKLEITKQAISKALRNGILIKHKVGKVNKVDLNCPKTKAYIKSSTSARHIKQSPKPQSKPKSPPPGKKAIKQAPPSPESIANAEAYHDKQEIERLNKLQATRKLELHNAKERGELIKREIVQRFEHRKHEIDNGQWRKLGMKISSDVAAVFGIEDEKLVRKACDVIDREVNLILKQIKREQNKYLKGVGAEKISRAGNQNAA